MFKLSLWITHLTISINLRLRALSEMTLIGKGAGNPEELQVAEHNLSDACHVAGLSARLTSSVAFGIEKVRHK